MRRRDERVRQKQRALTIVEVLIVAAVSAVLVGVAVRWVQKSKVKADRLWCTSNLKGIGLGYRIWATDRTNRFPWQISSNNGGTRQLVPDVSQIWRHVAAISNELSTPQAALCSSDTERRKARDFSEFNSNQNLSYFIGLGASFESPQSILSGDRNLLLDGSPLPNRIVTFSSNANASFDQRIHRTEGNVLLGDGSVQMVTSARLREAIRDAAKVSTNTLMIP